MTEQEKTDMIFELLDDFTSGGKLYYHEESIWMINPNVKQWIFEFEKSGDLWYSYPVFTNIFKWISMEHPDFVPYIKKWVERILQNEVKNTKKIFIQPFTSVERILQNEVKNTGILLYPSGRTVERILQNEVKNTQASCMILKPAVERILQNEVKDTIDDDFMEIEKVERILQNEVKDTGSFWSFGALLVERILQNGIKNTDRPLPDYEPNLDIIKFEN